MDNWNELRSAFHLARLGSVNAAADALGLHRATVVRHIEHLETTLGEPLFLRSAKGYTPTKAGRELMRVAQTADEQFQLLEHRIRSQAKMRAGELIVTSLGVVGTLILPAILEFTRRHPQVQVQHIASARTLKLEKGEAHIAVRARSSDEAPDNVVQAFRSLRIGLFASPTYVEAHGVPKTIDAFKNHRFVALGAGPDAVSSQIYRSWLDALEIDDANVVFRSTSMNCVEHALFVGVGLGFIPSFLGRNFGMIEIDCARADRWVHLDLVTHADVHRSDSVQSMLQMLREFTQITDVATDRDPRPIR